MHAFIRIAVSVLFAFAAFAYMDALYAAESSQESDVDFILSPPDKPRKNAYAVIIGIETYRDEKNVSKASFAVNDADYVTAYVTGAMGYAAENVRTLRNERATKSDMNKYIEGWLPNVVEKDDSVFVYFSGHGTPHKTKEGYLVPYDGDPTFVETTGYPLKRLYDALGQLPAKEVVVVLDSCFSGAGARSVIPVGTKPMALRVEDMRAVKGKTVALSASSEEQTASTYLPKKHGLMTYFFLKGLQGEADTNKDGAVDLEELYRYLKPQVQKLANREYNNEQTPQLIPSREMQTQVVRLMDRIPAFPKKVDPSVLSAKQQEEMKKKFEADRARMEEEFARRERENQDRMAREKEDLDRKARAQEEKRLAEEARLAKEKDKVKQDRDKLEEDKKNITPGYIVPDINLGF